jgi:hypothetical protein
MTPDTLLLRQVHPKFMDGSVVTSQAFMPFPRDDGKLSVYDGDQIGASDAHQHYTGTLGNQSCGVWAVTKAESDAEGVEGGPDPLPNFPAHAIIDFGSLPEKVCRKIAKRLKAIVNARGCQFDPS